MRFTTLIFFFEITQAIGNGNIFKDNNTRLMGFFYFFFSSIFFFFFDEYSTVSLSKIYITIMQEPFKKNKIN